MVWIAVQREAKMSGLGAHGVVGRVAMVFYSFFYYPWMLVWPVELSPLYEVRAHVDPFPPRFVVALVVVASSPRRWWRSAGTGPGGSPRGRARRS